MAKYGDRGGTMPLTNDHNVRQWFDYMKNVAWTENNAVCLTVRALNTEESELFICPIRAPATTAQIALSAAHPKFSQEDTVIISKLAQHTRPLLLPAHRDDWLAQNIETRMSVAERQELWGRFSASKIYIVPVVISDKVDPLPLVEVQKYVSAFFDTAVAITQPLYLHKPAPGEACAKITSLDKTVSVNVDYREYCKQAETAMPHGQYKATHVLNGVLKTPGVTCPLVLGITMADLFIDSDDLFSMGAASYTGGGVFSFRRYTNAMKPAAVPPDMLVNHGCKTAAHELMHMLDIKHCTFADCIMNGSGHLLEDARIPHHMCAVCTAQLKVAMGDGLCLARRQAALESFFATTPGFANEKASLAETTL
jgi:predicted Zn-dependent protease